MPDGGGRAGAGGTRLRSGRRSCTATTSWPSSTAGLNPERVMGAAFSLGIARLAMGKATGHARERRVWGTPIGAHQGVSHPLAACQVEIELARPMTQKAAG